jgi:ectoine hydroxylase-related dioxygenase (phytanoyl-CoA dioxygenase family)
MGEPRRNDTTVREEPSLEAGSADAACIVDTRGFAVLPSTIPDDDVERALRRLHLEVRDNGLTAAQIADWERATCWFPHLRWAPEIVSLLDRIPPSLREGTLCEPQILLQFPEDGERPIYPHVDQPPPWAQRRPYRIVIGVALSASLAGNGALLVWPFDRRDPELVELARGDVVVMHPQLQHTGGRNVSGTIRYAVYFRFLDDRGEARLGVDRP